MSIYKKDTIFGRFPAYDIVERECDRDGFVNITHGESLGLHRKWYYQEFKPGSVVSYALEYNNDPLAAVERAKANGHELHWINACATCITAHKQERRTLVLVTLGMRVRFEGLLATIEEAPNDNLRLAPIVE